MIETDVKHFWQGALPVEELATKLANCVVDEGLAEPQIRVQMANEAVSKFEVTPKLLLQLVDAVLKRSLTESDLSTIAYILILSEHYTWNGETPEGEIVSTTVFDWDSFDSNFPLSRANVKRWKTYLITGEYVFNDLENQ